MEHAFLPAALLLAAFAMTAQAQSYPSKPIRFIVPFAPGGSNDIIARMVGSKLSETWGQSVVIDNRGGAGGVIGADIVAKSAPDGYTLLMANINFATNPGLVKNLPYDAIRDFAAVSRIATSPVVLVVHPSFPARSVRELVSYAKSKPGQISYSSSGAGATGHIAMELLKQMASINMTAVHYKGAGPGLIDLIAGRVSPGFVSILSVTPYLQTGRLRALAVSTSHRSPALPDIPTVAEAGVPGYDFTGWWGMVVPARTPPAVVDKLNAALVKILAQPDVRERFTREGANPASTTPAEFTAYMRAEVAKWSTVIKEANIRID